MQPSTGYTWRQVPRWSAVLFFAGVFSLFSTIGIIGNITELGRQSPLRLALGVILAGGFAVLYALLGFTLRQRAWMAMLPVLAAHFTILYFLGSRFPSPARPAALSAGDVAQMEHGLSMTAILLVLAVVGGYVFFLVFSITEGRRYFRVHAEMQLAREIHRVLVPPIALRRFGYEFHGHSQPSGEVGGDLIDVVASDHGWVAYVADVSGHGVAPGVVMGMVKSAARMHLTNGGATEDLLPRLHAVIQPLMKPNMFVTVAYLATGEQGLRYALAGHPPILHYHAATGEISELACRSLPVGLLPDSRFQSSSVECAPGDLFVLTTDGLLEAANDAGEEFGLSGIKTAVSQSAGFPLERLNEAVVQAARRHGRIVDDQSLVLVRGL